jgi:hypothetical protein
VKKTFCTVCVPYLSSTSKPFKASTGSHVEPKTTYTSRHPSSSVHHSTRPTSNSHFGTKKSIATSIHSSSAVNHSTRPASDSHIGTKKSIATSIHSRTSVHHPPTATRSVHTSGHKTPSGTSTGTSIKPSNMSSTSHSQHLSSRNPSVASSISRTHHIVASVTSVHFSEYQPSVEHPIGDAFIQTLILLHRVGLVWKPSLRQDQRH